MNKPNSETSFSTNPNEQPVELDLSGERREFAGNRKQVEARYSQDHYQRRDLDDWFKSDAW